MSLCKGSIIARLWLSNISFIALVPLTDENVCSLLLDTGTNSETVGVIEKQPKHPDVQPKQTLVDPKVQAHKNLEQTLEDPDDKPRESLEETPQAPVAQSHEGP